MSPFPSCSTWTSKSTCLIYTLCGWCPGPNSSCQEIKCDAFWGTGGDVILPTNCSLPIEYNDHRAHALCENGRISFIVFSVFAAVFLVLMILGCVMKLSKEAMEKYFLHFHTAISILASIQFIVGGFGSTLVMTFDPVSMLVFILAWIQVRKIHPKLANWYSGSFTIHTVFVCLYYVFLTFMIFISQVVGSHTIGVFNILTTFTLAPLVFDDDQEAIYYTFGPVELSKRFLLVVELVGMGIFSITSIFVHEAGFLAIMTVWMAVFFIGFQQKDEDLRNPYYRA